MAQVKIPTPIKNETQRFVYNISIVSNNNFEVRST